MHHSGMHCGSFREFSEALSFLTLHGSHAKWGDAHVGGIHAYVGGRGGGGIHDAYVGGMCAYSASWLSTSEF